MIKAKRPRIKTIQNVSRLHMQTNKATHIYMENLSETVSVFTLNGYTVE